MWSDETLVITLASLRLVAHAAEEDAAAGGLEDGDVDVAAVEDRLARRPGPVQSPGSTIVAADDDAVGRRRPDPAARLAQDVGDQPGRRGLAVRAA